MIEWCASSYFSFLEGARSPTDLLTHAIDKGYAGLGLADRMGQYGLVEALRARDQSSHGHKFFYAPGIRLHFDVADPLIVYPLHKSAHARLSRFLSEWALEGMKHHEKGLTPLPWQHFKKFLKEEKSKAPLKKSFILISVNGRFFPWVEAPVEGHKYRLHQTKKKKTAELTRVQAQEARAPTPSFASPPAYPGFCPMWLLELIDLCEKGRDSALSLAYPLTFSPGLEDLHLWLEEESRTFHIPLLATTLPLFCEENDQDLCDLITAIRHTCRIKDLGYLRQANGDRRLLTQKELKAHHARIKIRLTSKELFNDPIAHTLELARRQHFSLSELKYRYPKENIPENESPSSFLRRLVYDGAKIRYPDGIPSDTRSQIEHELSLICELEYEDYFLTIWDILKYARDEKILFQGRGSAANSTVCFCLGITAIDPVRMNLLFERFLSVERHEPPDIDVDFEHERREEVMQEVYRRYGRDRAAMVATYITFRSRMAVRETAKALGVENDSITTLIQFLGREGLRGALRPAEKSDAQKNSVASCLNHHASKTSAAFPSSAEQKKSSVANLLQNKTKTKFPQDSQTGKNFNRILKNNTSPNLPHQASGIDAFLKTHKISKGTWARLLHLVPRLVGTPRHLGLHTGGFILSSDPLVDQCVLEPARMENRSVVPWDKIDVEYLKWMKVDLLSLGMLTAIRKCFDHLKDTQNIHLDLKSVPAECPKVYAALGRADTVGVFQIESRAQMNMLPRLLPKTFYDLVVEVAIVRPGPLQGGMVHPYLRRRQKLEPVRYDHPSLEPILKKTLGVPIFQEQVMKMAVAIAGFTPGEADQLRKVMSGAWRSKSHMHKLKTKLLDGMAAHGISGDFADRVYKQIEGFGEYGFPESHAASFAILTYVSSYLKIHHPSEFLTALLNSQPMGFYSPRALVHDAERHGVRVLPVDIFKSRHDSTLEHNPQNTQLPFVRMGFSLIKGFSPAESATIERLQKSGVLSFEHEELPSLEELRTQFGLELRTLEKLIRAGALHGLTRASGLQKLSHAGAELPSNSKKVERVFLNSTHDTRREELWQLLPLKRTKNSQTSLSLENSARSAPETLHKISAWESLLNDYSSTGLTPKSQSTRSEFSHYHPAQFARSEFFAREAWVKSSDLFDLPARSRIKVIGLVSTKQKPPTAGGLVFVTLEDECGFFNLVLMPDVFARVRLVLEGGSVLAAEGILEKSLNSNPHDKYTVAASIKVTELWNPFLRVSHETLVKNKTRAWH